MSETFEKKTFAPGEILLDEGDNDNPAYLILSGKVEVRKGTKSDYPKTIAVLKKGEVIGEMSLFDNSPHDASVIAVDPTTVGVLTASEFKRRIDAMDPLMRGILTILVKRLREAGSGISAKKGDTNLNNWKK